MKKNTHQHNESMYKGAPISSFIKAKELRKNMTPAEQKLWNVLKQNKIGVKFRRQHPILIYIVDFYCHKHRLVIELDGEYHNKKEQRFKDEERTKALQEIGLQVLRFCNNQVLNDIETVLITIKNIIEEKSK